FFFFQAEDGIRDRNVTGVQTCALPISTTLENFFEEKIFRTAETARAQRWSGEFIFRKQRERALTEPTKRGTLFRAWGAVEAEPRSEERRVGKERRARGGEEKGWKKERG